MENSLTVGLFLYITTQLGPECLAVFQLLAFSSEEGSAVIDDTMYLDAGLDEESFGWCLEMLVDHGLITMRMEPNALRAYVLPEQITLSVWKKDLRMQESEFHRFVAKQIEKSEENLEKDAQNMN